MSSIRHNENCPCRGCGRPTPAEVFGDDTDHVTPAKVTVRDGGHEGWQVLARDLATPAPPTGEKPLPPEPALALEAQKQAKKA